jgi:predicted metalloprotease with PDZ domain
MALVGCLLATAPARATSTEPTRFAEESVVQVIVDARDIQRRVVTSKVLIPAKPGPLTLYFPKWIPGTHGPFGPVTKLAGIQLKANGQSIPWKRDSDEMCAFHCEVSQNVGAVEAELLYVVAPRADYLEVSVGVAASKNLAILNWNALLLYPGGADQSKVLYQPKLLLPANWKGASSLAVASQSPGVIDYTPVTLERLVDSPVLAGAYLRSIPLEQVVGVPHYLDVATDDENVKVPADLIAGLSQVANEADALFGGRGYRSFHFLLGISDSIPNFGLEHHESTVNTVSTYSLTNDPRARWWLTFLLAHEYVHSWDGKHRRPADMIAPNFHAGLKTDLLWVYEGLTQYLGMVLDTRAGFWTKQQFRDELATTAAGLELPSRRAWRSVLDTAIAAPLHSGAAGASWRTQSDYYYECVFIWLEADTIIRQLSHGKKSIDNFCQDFFNRHGGKPIALGYTFDDVIAAMNATQPYDWTNFFRTRLQSVGGKLPTAGIENAGWKLVYTDEPCAKARGSRSSDLSHSIGLLLARESLVADVIYDSPAWKAGIGPGMKLVSVNKKRWSLPAWRDALASAAQNGGKIEIQVEDEGATKNMTIAYGGVERFPHLQADPARFDMLDEILRPRTPPVPVAGKN